MFPHSMWSRVWVGAVAPRLTKGQEVLGDRWGPASCSLQREPVQWMSVVAVSNGLDLLARETLTNQEKASNCSGEACGKNEHVGHRYSVSSRNRNRLLSE